MHGVFSHGWCDCYTSKVHTLYIFVYTPPLRWHTYVGDPKAATCQFELWASVGILIYDDTSLESALQKLNFTNSLSSVSTPPCFCTTTCDLNMFNHIPTMQSTMCTRLSLISIWLFSLTGHHNFSSSRYQRCPVQVRCLKCKLGKHAQFQHCVICLVVQKLPLPSKLMQPDESTSKLLNLPTWPVTTDYT